MANVAKRKLEGKDHYYSYREGKLQNEMWELKLLIKDNEYFTPVDDKYLTNEKVDIEKIDKRIIKLEELIEKNKQRWINYNK
jgi:hypothetical protein